MTTIAYHTLGCKVNQYETERIRAELESAGFETVPFSSRADVYLINTCTVTAVADSKSRAAVRKAAKLNPDAFVIVAGCYADLEPGRIAEIEGVDLVVPNDEKDAIVERVMARYGSIPPHPNPLPPGERESGPSTLSIQHSTPRLRTRAVVKVQDGCDQFCSYCVVPFARRGMRSRDVEDTLAEIHSLAGFGYKEIVLSGIRLGSYADGSVRLPELITRVTEIGGVERIRLSSIEPWEVDEALLRAMQSPQVCRHLHIPLQSGDDTILRAMNRPYDSVAYLRLIEHVKSSIAGIGITTDAIVGFPGETGEAFQNTCKMIDTVGFARVHVFRYSSRDRTRAASMPDQVDEREKKRRSNELLGLGKRSARRFAESMIGQEVQVLAEKRTVGKVLTGYADNYVEVLLPGGRAAPGEIVRARAVGVDQDGRLLAEGGEKT